MNKSITIYGNGQVASNLYQKQDGTLTTWSANDIIAVKLVIIILGAVILSLLA
jgi:hypothetical protein